MSSDLRKKMEVMRDKFLMTVPAKLDVADELLAQAQTRDTTTSLHRLLHEICGSAGMFGCRDIHADLREALVAAEIADGEDRTLTTEEAHAIAGHLSAVRATIAGEVAVHGGG